MDVYFLIEKKQFVEIIFFLNKVLFYIKVCVDNINIIEYLLYIMLIGR